MKTLVLLASFVILQIIPPPSGTVTGQVRAADGSPAVDVDVSAMQMEQYGNVDPATAILGGRGGRTDAEGRYRLERVPPGRYYITAGFANSPTYYPGVKTRQEARSIGVAANQVLSGIDFKLATSVGVRVRGRVINLPTTFPSDFLNITLQSIDRSLSRNQPVPRDGRFEFSRIVPGRYDVHVTPRSAPAVRIEVSDKDVNDVTIDAGVFAFGRASVDDGSSIPRVAFGAGTRDALGLAHIQEMQRGAWSNGGGGVEQRGRFILPLDPASLPADYTILPVILPLGYYVKSMTAGDVDLLRFPLTFTRPPLTEIKVVLTKTPTPGAPVGVKVSGRVTELVNARPRDTVYLSLVSSPTITSPTRMVGETAANKDGTFEFRNVPPGRYVVRTWPESSKTIEITDSDISNLELPLPRIQRSLRPAPPPPPAVPQAGRLFFTLTGDPPLYDEGFITFFRIDQAGTRVEEVRMDAVPFVTLQPGSYSLRSYLRPCSGYCGLLDAPRSECSAAFSIARGQVLNAERVMQGETCAIRFKTTPAR